MRYTFNSYREYASGRGLRRENEEELQKGHTLYLGSPKSELHFCIYEKAFEQYIKFGIPLEDAPVQNRFEIRLKNDRALNAVKDLTKNYDIYDTAFSIINRYVCFLDREEGKEASEWSVDPNWLWFVGEDRGKLKLTTKPEPYTWEKSLNWLNNQCSHILATAIEIDEKQGTSYISDMIERARDTLPDKHKKIVEQVTTSMEEVCLQQSRESTSILEIANAY